MQKETASSSYNGNLKVLATPRTAARQALLFTELSRLQLPFPSPGDLPDSRVEPRSPTRQADSLQSEQPGKRKRRELLASTVGKNLKENLPARWTLKLRPH